MHGITMIFLFVIPMTTGAFGNYLIPLMIGARDMAFPRMNALSYWIYLASGIFMYVALAQGHAPNAGWFDYVPLASKQFDPGNNIDFYGWGLIFNGISSTAAAINFIVTIFKLRAPGMSINRMPLFCFAFLAVAFALLFALPVAERRGSVPRARSPAWVPLLRRLARRRPAVVAEPVLDLRAPRGLHHHPAGVRDRDLDHPRVRASPDGAVPAGRAVGDPGRVPRLRRLGAPHVHGRVLEPDDRLLRRREPDHRDPVGDPAVRLDHHDPDRHAGLPDAAAVHRRLHRLLHHRRPVGDHAGGDPVRPAGARQLLRRRPLPLRDLRRGGVPDPRRDVLLVPEGHRTDVPRGRSAS